jgi:hypothetical protein
MSWVSRDGKSYYYTTVRRGRTVHSIYRGSGNTAHTVARLTAESRQEKAAQREQLQREQADLEAVLKPLDDLCELTDSLVAATMLLSGWHRHDRGPWRLKQP